jgi:hypothetical protein
MAFAGVLQDVFALIVRQLAERISLQGLALFFASRLIVNIQLAQASLQAIDFVAACRALSQMLIEGAAFFLAKAVGGQVERHLVNVEAFHHHPRLPGCARGVRSLNALFFSI